MHRCQPLHFDLDFNPVRIDFHQDAFDLRIRDETRNFRSLQQLHNYLRAIYGHSAGKAVVALVETHLK